MASRRQEEGKLECARCGRRGQNGFELDYGFWGLRSYTYGKYICSSKNSAACIRREAKRGSR